MKKFLASFLALLILSSGAVAVAQADDTFTLSDEQKAYVEEWHVLAEDLSAEVDARLAEELGNAYDPDMHGINWTYAMAQSIFESTAGNSPYAKKYKNVFGIGGHMDPVEFGSYEESWEYYYDLVSYADRYVEEGSLRYKDDPEAYFTALVDGGYCPDPYYAGRATEIVGGVELYAAERAEAWEAERAKREELAALKKFEREMKAPIEALEEFLES